MKFMYEIPEMEIVKFEMEDIITSSGGGMSNMGDETDENKDVINFKDLFPGL